MAAEDLAAATDTRITSTVEDRQRPSAERRTEVPRLVWEQLPERVAQLARERMPLLIEEDDSEWGLNLEAGEHPHILIEADNYDALLALGATHRARIDMVFIDPPGSSPAGTLSTPHGEVTSFLYDGGYVDAEDPLRYRKWLSFMAPRLKLAWELLSARGVMVIQAGAPEDTGHYRVLGDSLFGHQNFIATLNVRIGAVGPKSSAAAAAGAIVNNTEHVLIWARNGRSELGVRPLYEAAPYDENYSIFLEPCAGEAGEYRELKLIDVALGDTGLRAELDRLGLLASGDPSITDAYERSPRFRAFVHEHSERIVREQGPSDEGADRVERPRLAEQIQPVSAARPERRVARIRGNWWDGYHVDMRARAEALAGIEVEDPVTARIARLGLLLLRLVRDLLRLLAPPDATVLDFFAGSGTTGHALLALNAEEGARRRAILVTNDEQNSAARWRGRGCASSLRARHCGSSPAGLREAVGSTVEARRAHSPIGRGRALLTRCASARAASPRWSQRTDSSCTAAPRKLLGVLYDERSDEELLAAVRNIHGGEQEVAVYTFGGVRD